MASSLSKNIALVLAGGSGERFGSPTPKQFISMCGKPLICHCLLSLQESPLIDEIYIVAKGGTLEKTQQIAHEYQLTKVKAVITGGNTRKESCFKGLSYLRRIKVDPDDIILICDGDRPNLPLSLIRENVESAKTYGAAVTAITATDSIFYSEAGALVDHYVPRSMMFQAQTPQTFRFSIIYAAHKKAKANVKYDLYTDDASLVAALTKTKIAIVEGSKENIKVNTPQDEAIFAQIRRNIT